MEIKQLTPEQEALIPSYRDRWKAVALSTQPLDKQKAAIAIESAYELIEFPKPHLFFFPSPIAALKEREKLSKELGKKRKNLLSERLLLSLERKLNCSWDKNLETFFNSQFYSTLVIFSGKAIIRLVRQEIKGGTRSFIRYDIWATRCWKLDFYFTVLGCSCQQPEWDILQLIVRDCGWILPYENICLMSERPVQLSVDRQNRSRGDNHLSSLPMTGRFTTITG